MKRKYIWAYLDGKPLVEVIQAALDNNMTVDDVKKLLIRKTPGMKSRSKSNKGDGKDDYHQRNVPEQE